MSSTRIQDDYNRQILQAIGSGQRVTQRSLASELGVALGLTNLLIRRLVAKGYVRVSRMGARHVGYLMTASGWEALGSATRSSFENTVHLYTETRETIRLGLAAVSERCTPDEDGRKRVVFYGAGDVAEIAFVSLQRTDLTLAGVVDDRREGEFFGYSICRPEQLSATHLGATRYGHVIVTSVRHSSEIQARLLARAIPMEQISLLDAMPKPPRSESKNSGSTEMER